MSAGEPLATTPAERILGPAGDAPASLLDLVDHVLNQGVVLDAEITLGLAGVDLVYLRLSALACAADRVFGGRRR